MRRLLLILVFVLLPTWANAGDLVATWKYSDGSKVVVSMRDDNHIRMDNDADNYTLLLGKKMYMVSRSEGEWQVVDMDQMAGMMQMVSKSAKVENYTVSYTPTGGTETVAGFSGKVYDCVVKNGSKVVDKGQVVMSKDDDVVRANKAWMVMARRMAKLMGSKSGDALDRIVAESENNGYGGVLRYDKDMQVQSIVEVSLKDSTFQLPKGATQLDMSEEMQQVEQSAEEDGLSQDAKDIGNAAHDEAKDATVDEVREGVRNIFNNVFN